VRARLHGRGEAIVQAFYGLAPALYCRLLAGGHHALMEGRLPEDYDGIIGGDPANNWNHLMLRRAVDRVVSA
jgi:hypothetical protein